MSITPSGLPGGSDGSSPADATASASVADGNWHMVAYSYTGVPGSGNGLLYVDGVPVANDNVIVAPAGDNLDVWIGGSPDYGTGRLFTGKIANAAIYPQALNSTQVQNLYSGIYAGPVNLNAAHTGANIVLSWPAGTLLQAPTLTGPWTTNSTAVSPYTTPATNAVQFFRVLVQ